MLISSLCRRWWSFKNYRKQLTLICFFGITFCETLTETLLINPSLWLFNFLHSSVAAGNFNLSQAFGMILQTRRRLPASIYKVKIALGPVRGLLKGFSYFQRIKAKIWVWSFINKEAKNYKTVSAFRKYLFNIISLQQKNSSHDLIPLKGSKASSSCFFFLCKIAAQGLYKGLP